MEEELTKVQSTVSKAAPPRNLAAQTSVDLVPPSSVKSQKASSKSTAAPSPLPLKSRSLNLDNVGPGSNPATPAPRSKKQRLSTSRSHGKSPQFFHYVVLIILADSVTEESPYMLNLGSPDVRQRVNDSPVVQVLPQRPKPGCHTLIN